MSKRAYYNENDPYVAQWLRNLIAAGLIPAGDVDERSITDVRASDLAGYTQVHLFAGIGGWALAARLAGWADDREIWTGSAPCQPYSVAGKGKAQSDDRHLWPHYFRLIRAHRPAVVMGEQVAAAVGKDWLDGVFADLEAEGYACGAAVVPACAVNAPHRRDRVWFVANAAASGQGRRRVCGPGESVGENPQRPSSEPGRYRESPMGHAIEPRLEGLAGHGDDATGWPLADRPVAAAGCDGDVADADQLGARSEWTERSRELGGVGGNPWSCYSWIIGHDGKARRTPEPESGIRLLAHGVPARVGKLRAYGNAIVPQIAAEVIGAYMDTQP